MRLFGLTISKAAPVLTPVPSRSWTSWLGIIREPFTGAWQRNLETESPENILKFSPVYTCITLIAGDIAKLRIKLVEFVDGIWKEVTAPSPFSPVLRKPNVYQTRIQFIEQWIISKLIYGNTYVLKERDQRGIVTALYVLDPRLVEVLVADNGDVYYRLNRDPLSSVLEPVTIPASEIIHDRTACLWHPLIGVPPIYACAASTTQGIRIQNNSAKFFENMSRPSGHLTAPGNIPDETAARLKAEFEAKFGGSNIGKTLVTGDGLKYEPMTIPADQMQLIEQLRWTGQDVASAFHVPLHKLGIGQPTLNNIGALNQDYYSQCLQEPIEALELLLDEGLGLVNVPGRMLGTELDLDGLLRMDPASRADINSKLILSAQLKPNEGRASEGRVPVEGGDQCFLQQQNFSLAALAKRDAQPDPFASKTPAAPALPAPDANKQVEAEYQALMETITRGLEHV